MLDMTIHCLQVYWEGSKIACFILFVFICLQGGCSWPNSSTAFWVGRAAPAPIVVWQLNEQALAPVSVQQ